MASTANLKALGLNLQMNQLEVPPGSLVKASNVIIKRDDVLESRRGYNLFGNSFGTSSDRAKQLMTYKQRILRHYSNQLQFDTGVEDTSGTEIFASFAGNYLEPQTGRRIRFIEANSNFYFTTSDGVKKISAKNASDLTTASGFITQAGGVKALDFTARLNITPGSHTGFLPQDSAVAYRIVWGITDANNNLILGSPSQRVVIYNPLNNLMLQDFNRVLGALDNVSDAGGSLISDGNYVSTLELPITASANQLLTNLESLAAKIDTDILYADTAGGTPLGLGGASSVAVSTNVATITFDSGTATDYFIPGSHILLSGFTGSASVVNGAQTISTVGASTITFNITTGNFSQSPVTTGQIFSNEFRTITQPAAPSTPATNQQLVDIQTYLDNIITQLQSEPTTGSTPVISSASQTAFIAPLDITTSATVILNITIPSAITTNYFYQVYRSDVAQASGTEVLATDVAPNDELRLVYEAFPTSAEISAHTLQVEDITPDAFRGANLYTNATTGEGILQANDVPPFCLDINTFKNVAFYANTRTRQRETINMLGVVNMVNDFGSGLDTKTFTSGGVNTSTDTITISSHGYTDGQSVTFTNSTPSNLPGGITQGVNYFIINSATNTFQISATLNGPLVDLTSGGTGTHTVQNQLPKIVITDGITTNTYSFVTGLEEITQITTVADVAGNLAGKYFTINSANDVTPYYVWYKVSGSGSDPSIVGKTGIEVVISTGASANAVAAATRDALNVHNADFAASASTNIITVNVTEVGYTTDATAGTSGFSINVTQQGRGEDATSKQILLSTSVSPAIAVDETSRSFVRIVNKNQNEIVNAFYLSGAADVPGQILFEARSLSTGTFYLLGNNSSTGTSFNPVLSPSTGIVSISVANPTVITTSTAHGMINKDNVVIVGSNSTPSVDGLYQITYISPTSFSINVNVTVAGNAGAIIPAVDAVASDNEQQKHRIYYSKLLQPEAVPIVNFMDVGAQDKAILRIFPLRDSLFVLKEDGLFRISGETAPFNLALFDSSCILIAADSVSVSNNLIYGWTTQGIVAISESGVNIISRPIDIEILKLATAQYANFRTATWGIGYESDNSYTVYTVSATDDVYATVGYRFSTLTNTWTTFDKTNTCGVINDANDTQYLGAGDTNFIEQERKNFDRTDYADREFQRSLTTGNYFGPIIKLADISNIVEGDVITQDQNLTVYQYNSLLKQLDTDVFLNHDYFSTQNAVAGDNLRTKLDSLLDKIATDSGRTTQPGYTSPSSYTALKSISAVSTISSISASNPTLITTSSAHNLQTGRIILISGSDSTPSVDGTYQVTVMSPTTFTIPISVTQPGTTGTFTVENDSFLDVEASFNQMITLLDNDAGVGSSAYVPVTTDTLLEAIVLSVDLPTKKVTLSLALDFIVGPLTVYKAINTTTQWAPITMGDPLSFKHFREPTLMFENRQFFNATLSFSSDLLPQFIDIPFVSMTNGIFGFNDFGYNYFGGVANSAPFRTYVPRPIQRCRYLNTKFNHQVAREKYSIFGFTVTGDIISVRAYR